jgi:hypothetical protein
MKSPNNSMNQSVKAKKITFYVVVSCTIVSSLILSAIIANSFFDQEVSWMSMGIVLLFFSCFLILIAILSYFYYNSNIIKYIQLDNDLRKNLACYNDLYLLLLIFNKSPMLKQLGFLNKLITSYKNKNKLPDKIEFEQLKKNVESLVQIKKSIDDIQNQIAKEINYIETITKDDKQPLTA